MGEASKVAIVTGAGSGIGAATARLLAQSGVAVAVNFHTSRDGAEATAAACEASGGSAIIVSGDVASDADCRRLVDETVARWGRLDYLVNNAGTTKQVRHGDLEGLSAEDFQRIYAVNTIGAFQMARAAAPHIKRAGNGAIVNVSSTASLGGTGSSIAYAASKAALNAITMSLARVLGPEIRVNAVCPGFVATPWAERAYGPDGLAERIKAVAAASPLGRAITADDVASSIRWLLDGATTMTGECLVLDGGGRLGQVRRR